MIRHVCFCICLCGYLCDQSNIPCDRYFAGLPSVFMICSRVSKWFYEEMRDAISYCGFNAKKDFFTLRSGCGEKLAVVPMY